MMDTQPTENAGVEPLILNVPELAMVALVGASGSGKSTFGAAHFSPTEVLSSDRFRGMVSNDENSLDASADAFDALHHLLGIRLKRGLLTVVDATNVQSRGREALVRIARDHHVLPVAIVLDLPAAVCQARNDGRPDRQFGPHVVRNHCRDLRRSLKRLKREGFRHVFVLKSEADIARVQIERVRLWNNLRHEHGPFDIIGDIHGCYEELVALLRSLGWTVDGTRTVPPEGRRAIFVGDLNDRGPNTPGVLKLVMQMVEDGQAFCVLGNHEAKLEKYLSGRAVKQTHGLAETVEQLEAESAEVRAKTLAFIKERISHYVLHDGELVVAHAGIREEMQGRTSGKIRSFCLYGETTGEVDEFGLPVRADWAQDYRGQATVVYGHTPVLEAEWVNKTICIDTGCVFGGKLTALRWPENELVSVPAARTYYEPVKPLKPAAPPRSDQPDIRDVLGGVRVTTRFDRTVTIQPEYASAALEVMTRFTVDPRWLVYLPPTMSPVETCADGPWLERPEAAFDYYARHGQTRVMCQEKHMGSRALVLVCRSEAAAASRFGPTGRLGRIVTRTGRAFFREDTTEAAVLESIRAAAESCNLFKELASDWLLLDAELLPWSAKARGLIESQYAAVGVAGVAALSAAQVALEMAAARDPSAAALRDSTNERLTMVSEYDTTWAAYCWSVESPSDLRVAPFHLLASEGVVYDDRSHRWHMDTLAPLAAASPLMTATRWREVVLDSVDGRAEAVQWWEEHTAANGEGMVVKPETFLAKAQRGWTQPAVKVRGRPYLRIIYGPEYTAAENLERLRKRGLGKKRSLAMREFLLGLEGLHRFVENAPPYQVHQCVYGVLALESEPVDPRL